VVEGEHRLYLKEWIEPDGKDGTVHRCKVRMLPDTMPEFLVDGEGQRRFSGCSVAVFFDMVVQARAAAATYVDEWGIGAMEGVTGEVGEEFGAGGKVAPKAPPAAQMAAPRPAAPRPAAPAPAPSAAPKPPAPRPTVAGLPAPRAPIPVRK
jgi:hypothetical protein